MQGGHGGGVAAETRHLVDHEWSRSAQPSSASAQPKSAQLRSELHVTSNQDTPVPVALSIHYTYKPLFCFILLIHIYNIKVDN